MDCINAFIHLNSRLKTHDLRTLSQRAQAENPWFTEENIRLACAAISKKMLDERKLRAWLQKYPQPADFQPKNVGIIMAGNIPLVGFFDLLCVCASGHRAYVKMSSKDQVLMQFVVDTLQKAPHPPTILPLTDNSPLDTVIATGSDNTKRYFSERYDSIPHLLRGSRTSIAVLTGKESNEELHELSHDIFDHLGMGCRNVTKIFVPKNYDSRLLINSLKVREITHPGYLNAYRRNKAILQIRRLNYIDGHFFTLRESGGFSETISDLIVTPYEALREVNEWIQLNDSELQCIVSKKIDHPRRVDFGRAQWPELTDYPDGQDVMAFLRAI